MTINSIKSEIYRKLNKLDEESLNEINEMVSVYIKKVEAEEHKENSTIELTDWQLKRIDESHKQISEGNCFSNEQADLLVEKWLRE